MRPTSNLPRLADCASRRLARLRAPLEILPSSGASIAAADIQVGKAVLEAMNLWANFSRSYYLSYLVKPKTRTGARVTLGNLTIVTAGDLLHLAVRANRGALAPAPSDRRDEPDWKEPRSFLLACQAAQPSNIATVQAALSLQTRVFYDLPSFRNFYAHRNEETAERAVRVAKTMHSIAGVRHPTAALMMRRPKRPQSLLLDWLDEMQVVMSCLCD